MNKFYFNIDDNLDDDFSDVSISTKSILKDKFYYCGQPISLDATSGKYIFAVQDLLNCYKLGSLLKEDADHLVILYKGFLLKDPFEISHTIKNYNVLNFINLKWDLTRKQIKRIMPRVKRLKRLKLHLMNKNLVNYLYNNLNEILEGHAALFGDNYALNLKAQIITTPFYIKHNNQFMIYNMENNEMLIPTIETEGNFLCTFLVPKL